MNLPPTKNIIKTSKMGKLVYFLILNLIFSLNAFPQEYKQDIRAKDQKEDPNNIYQSNEISKIDLLKALAIAGVKIFKFSLGKFDRSYSFELNLTEYALGKKINTQKIDISDNNLYVYYNDTINSENANKPFKDYIDQITFFAKDMDSLSVLHAETYASSIGGIKLKKMKSRKYQYYSWRIYSKTNCIINTDIPLLIYASSWYDKKYDIERFCGTVDLSRDEKETEELIRNSPHYYLISFRISSDEH
jgi:hypothetical protein